MKIAGIRTIQLILLLMAIYSPSKATGFADTDYETLTLRLYYEQKWDSLLTIGEEAIKKGYDYYYMRIRVGEAAFYKQRYVCAARHFEKALEFNSSDEYATGLLYKSFHYSYRHEEARWLLRQLPAVQAKALGRTDRKPLLYMEAGPAFANHIKQFEKNRQTMPGTYSEAYLNRNSQYFLAGANIPVGYRMKINTAFAALNFNKNRRMDIAYLDSLEGDYQVVQTEAYLSPSFNISRRIKISPAFRLAHVSLTNPLKSNDTLVQKFIGAPGNFTYNDYAYGGEASYSAPYWMLTAGAWLLQIDKLRYSQFSGTLFLRPFGNLNFYTITTLSLKTFDNNSEYIIYQQIGGKICHRFWGEVTLSLGNLSGTAEHNLQLIYNSFDKVRSMAGSRLIFNVNEFLNISLRYQAFFREGTELFFPVDKPGQIFSYNYMNQSITGGITWNLH